MTAAERAVLAASRARDLCLSLRRAAVGRWALERLRTGDVDALSTDELALALGLAWAAGDRALIRWALAAVAPERVGADPVLAAIRDAAG